jgi:hypothetical protein
LRIYQDGFRGTLARSTEEREVEMPWETPYFREITMSSEIGAYQEDFDERVPEKMVPARPLNEQAAEVPAQPGTGT